MTGCALLKVGNLAGLKPNICTEVVEAEYDWFEDILVPFADMASLQYCKLTPVVRVKSVCIMTVGQLRCQAWEEATISNETQTREI